MATAEKDTSAGNAAGREQDVVVTGRVAGQVAAPKHGDPTEDQGVPEGGSVIGVRVGSEAAVESGLDPVLPATGTALGDATRVRNKDIRARDEKERERRGLNGGNAVSVTFEGLMMVEVDGDSQERGGVRSGSFTGNVKESLVIRPLTAEEEAERTGSALATGAVARRADDLVTGSGNGGGGNPMKRSETVGVTSAEQRYAGAKATTSDAERIKQADQGQKPQPAGAQGTTTRTR